MYRKRIGLDLFQDIMLGCCNHMNQIWNICFGYAAKKISLKCVLLLIDQFLYCIEALHSKNILHRDIKSGYLCIGGEKICNAIFVFDFKLAKQVEPNTSAKCHQMHRSLIGTPAIAKFKCSYMKRSKLSR